MVYKLACDLRHKNLKLHICKDAKIIIVCLCLQYLSLPEILLMLSLIITLFMHVVGREHCFSTLSCSNSDCILAMPLHMPVSFSLEIKTGPFESGYLSIAAASDRKSASWSWFSLKLLDTTECRFGMFLSYEFGLVG